MENSEIDSTASESECPESKYREKKGWRSRENRNRDQIGNQKRKQNPRNDDIARDENGFEFVGDDGLGSTGGECMPPLI